MTPSRMKSFVPRRKKCGQIHAPRRRSCAGQSGRADRAGRSAGGGAASGPPPGGRKGGGRGGGGGGGGPPLRGPPRGGHTPPALLQREHPDGAALGNLWIVA